MIEILGNHYTQEDPIEPIIVANNLTTQNHAVKSQINIETHINDSHPVLMINENKQHATIETNTNNEINNNSKYSVSDPYQDDFNGEPAIIDPIVVTISYIEKLKPGIIDPIEGTSSSIEKSNPDNESS